MALIGDTSELDTMLYGGKYMLPEANSYTMTTPWGVVSSDVSGGFVRQQLQFFNSPAQVQVVYRCVTKTRVDFLKSFIRLHEGMPFIAALAVDTDEVEPYIVDIVGAPTWQENGFSGTCTLTYQVQPTPNADYDGFLQWSGPALGDDLSEFANWIAKTANEDLPDAKQMPIDATGTTSAFVSDLYYDNVTPVEFSDLVTFSRLSSATYIEDGVLKTAAANEPRFEDSGLLIEPQSTNLIASSETVIVPVSGGVTSVTYDTNSLPGFRLIRQVNNGTLEGDATTVASGLSFNVGDQLTVSAVFKMEDVLSPGRFRFRLGDAGYWREFNFYCDMRNEAAPGVTYTKTTPFSDKSLVKVTASWVCDTVKTNINVRIQSLKVAGVCNVGAFQFEKTSSATSYIPTTGAAVTRASDSAAVDMQPHTAGTIFAEFLSDAVAIERVVYTAGSVTLERLATGAIAVTSGAVTVTSAIVPAGSVKAAISYDGATLKLAVNGVVYSAASTLPVAGTSIELGASTFANVWQRSEAYDNARLIEVTQ